MKTLIVSLVLLSTAISALADSTRTIKFENDKCDTVKIQIDDSNPYGAKEFLLDSGKSLTIVVAWGEPYRILVSNDGRTYKFPATYDREHRIQCNGKEVVVVTTQGGRTAHSHPDVE